jgi:chromosomal replication initiation ATPase DnaA
LGVKQLKKLRFQVPPTAAKKTVKAVLQGQLDFGHASFARGTYLEAPQNEAARLALDTWATWPGGVMALVGEAGSGKSHLSSLWAQDVCAPVIEGAGLDLAKLNQLSEQGPLRAVVDHAENCDEMTLFALLTTLENAGGAVLLLADTPPASWPFVLPDLISRLRAISVTTLSAPEIDLLSRLIVRQSAARGYKIDETASTYLAQRIPRTFAATVAIVACMDEVVAPSLKSSQALAQRALQAYYGKFENNEEETTSDLFDF